MQSSLVSTDQQKSQDSLRVSLFSDLHFHRDPLHRVPFPGGDYCIQQRTRLILEKIAENSSVLSVCAGDLIDVGSTESYPELDGMLREFDLSQRLAFTPGNHDRTTELVTEIGMVEPSEDAQISGRHNYTIVRGAHHIIFVDSSPHTKAVGARGEVGVDAQEWLQGILQNMPEGHVAWIVTHYPTIAFSPLLPERSMMVDGLQVHERLKQFSSRVGAVIYGHVHHRHQHTVDGIEYLSLAPSSVPLVCRTPGVGEFDENGVVGFEDLVLHANGTFSREIQAVDVRATALDSGRG